MKELGEKSSYYHRELGRFLKESSIPMVLLIGEEIQETFQELGEGKSKLFTDKESLIEYVTETVEAGDVVLVKGSRLSKMEEIVEALI
jgi:UDP-N-acetylmuramoyl-tripeptide--D-alanyl-D-alanine ligase